MNQNIKKYEEQSYQITDYRIKNIGKAVKLLISEYNRLAKKAPLHNNHEGWAVLREELDDLWNEIKKKDPDRSRDAICKEVVSLGAVAMRFIVELCLAEEAEGELPAPVKEVGTVA